MNEKLKNTVNTTTLIVALVLFPFGLKEFFTAQSLTLVSGLTLGISLACFIFLLLMNRKRVVSVLLQKQTKYIALFVITLIIYIGISVLVYLFALNHDTHIDTTGENIYSLSDQTIKVLRNLENDVEIYGFYGAFEEQFKLGRQGMDDLLLQYTLYGDKFNYRLYNINKEPDIAEKHQVKVPGVLIVKSGEKEEKLAELDEQKITNAIIRVSGKKGKKIYFLEGHGERDPDGTDGRGVSQLTAYLENQQYTTEKLKISLSGGVVPNDCDLLIIPGLRADLFPIEWKGILDYIKRGGNLYIMLDPGLVPKTVSWVEKLGLKIGRNIMLVSQVSQLDAAMGNFYTILTSDYGNTPITRDFPFQIFLDKARTVESADSLPEGISAATLVSSGPNAHSQKVIILPMGKGMQRSGKLEREGSLPLGVTLTINTEKWNQPKVKLDGQEKTRLSTEHIKVPGNADASDKNREDIDAVDVSDIEARVVVIGDSELIMDYIFANRKGNMDFVLNTIAWLTDEGEMISIRPKFASGTPVFLSKKQMSDLFWWPVVFMPIIVLVIGGVVIILRKHKYAKHD